MDASSKPSESEADQSPADMLRALFAMQSDLNDYVFSKNEIAVAEGATLTMGAISEAALNGRLGVNDLPNQWLQRFAEAMLSELTELQSDLHWKWWSKDRIDLQNIRVELIDILHFLISAMISAGLTPERVFEIYQQKHAVNFNRQDTGYSQATKTEDDNRNIK
jgi:hypothetical protein